MIKTIPISAMFIALGLMVFLPKTSYAWGDDHQVRDDGRSHHEHGYRAHRNPDLTLVSGMDTIDRRVLIAGDVDQPEEVIDQPVQVIEVTAPDPTINEQANDDITVNVPNSSGGYTAITLKRWGNAYLGPQGEMYYPFPQISQLKAVYGI